MNTPKQEAERLIKEFMPMMQWKMGLDVNYVLKMSKQAATKVAREILKVEGQKYYSFPANDSEFPNRHYRLTTNQFFEKVIKEIEVYELNWLK